MTDRPGLAGSATGPGEGRCQTGKRPCSEKCRRLRDFCLSGRALLGPSRRRQSSLRLCDRPLRPDRRLQQGLGFKGPAGGSPRARPRPHSAARGPARPGATAGGSGGQLLPTGWEPRVAASQAGERLCWQGDPINESLLSVVALRKCCFLRGTLIYVGSVRHLPQSGSLPRETINELLEYYFHATEIT